MLNNISRYLFSFAAFAAAFSAQAQDVSADAVRKAESLCRQYRFSAAVDILEDALETSSGADSVAIEDALMLARNGESMLDYCVVASPVAKRRFLLEDFFLWLPLQDRSWRPVPNPLDASGGSEVKAAYVPDGSGKIFYSAPDGEGIRNIYQTVKMDSVWSAPVLVDEKLTSDSDDICPMLSPDGRQLFFASKGLYGMGGYDLYVSAWDEEANEWGVPVNLGVPYSSPYDDYLYFNTADGKYSVFASNRECPGTDSVWVYVVDFDSMPVRRSVSNPSEAAAMSLLNPSGAETSKGGRASDMPSDPLTMEYIRALRSVRDLRSRISAASADLDEDRDILAGTSGKEKEELSARILDKEMELISMRDLLKKEEKTLQDKEMDLFAEGIVINPEALDAATVSTEERSSSGRDFRFVKNSMGAPLDMKVLKPEPSFDYSFMILDEGRFAEDNTLPEGIVYQIQIFTSSSPATVKRLRGLSPVFMRRSGSSYIYSAGLFHTYSDCLSNLNKVKKAGFKSAFITAFLDGEKINVSKARSLEAEMVRLYNVTIVPSSGKALSESEKTAIHAVTSADLSRTVEDGAVIFVIGPFNDKAEASSVVSMLRAAGVSSARLQEVK